MRSFFVHQWNTLKNAKNAPKKFFNKITGLLRVVLSSLQKFFLLKRRTIARWAMLAFLMCLCLSSLNWPWHSAKAMSYQLSRYMPPTTPTMQETTTSASSPINPLDPTATSPASDSSDSSLTGIGPTANNPSTGIQVVEPSSTPSATSVPPEKTPSPTVTPIVSGTPALEDLTSITNQAWNQDSDIASAGWGSSESRFVRMSNGDLYMVYLATDASASSRTWHLMRKLSSSEKWTEVQHGDAGTGSVSLLRGPHDELHVFSWRGNGQTLHDTESTNNGTTFSDKSLEGKWQAGQGYSGSEINAQGDMIVFKTGGDNAGTFAWLYYAANTKQWSFNSVVLSNAPRLSYVFLGTGSQPDATIVAMSSNRLPLASDSTSTPTTVDSTSTPTTAGNAAGITCFHIQNLQKKPSVTSFTITQPQSQNTQQSNVPYLTDSYMDTLGRLHILYLDQSDRAHHAIVENGKLVKDVQLTIDSGQQMRIVQDAERHFFIISMSTSGKALNVYPGTANDTDGTELAPVVALDISRLSGCRNAIGCLAPTFTVPRSGDSLSDSIEGVYGSGTQDIYFQVNFHSAGKK